MITIAAFRYALGRSSYIVSEMVEWLMKFWNEFDAKTRKILLEETEKAVMVGSCGEECDQREWERFLEFAHKKTRIT